jgi:hypothetical protein
MKKTTRIMILCAGSLKNKKIKKKEFATSNSNKKKVYKV